MNSISLGAGLLSGLADRLTGEVLPGLEATLQRLTADAEHWLDLISRVYGPQAAGSQELFAEQAEQLRLVIAAGSLSLALELRSDQELQGGQAAYASGGAGLGERIPPVSAKKSARFDPSTWGPNRRPCNRPMTPLCGKPSACG
jgi:hypothetical protein